MIIALKERAELVNRRILHEVLDIGHLRMGVKAIFGPVVVVCHAGADAGRIELHEA